MRLDDRAGREYVFHADPSGTGFADLTDPLEVSFDGGLTWRQTEWDGIGTSRRVRYLIAGPEATNNPPGTIVLPGGVSAPRLRALANPEVVIRVPAGSISVPMLPDGE
jgi:hypothetical protein